MKYHINIQSLFITISSVLFLTFLIYPKGKEIYRSKMLLEQKKIRLSTADYAISRLTTLTKEYMQAKKLVDHEKKFLVLPKQIGTVLLLIDQALQGLEIELISVTPDYSRISEPFNLGEKFRFKLLPVRISFKGSYENVAHFIHNLTSSQKWTLMEQMRLEKKSESSASLSANVSIFFHIQDEGGEEADDR